LPNTKAIYKKQAERYHTLVSREDYQGKLLPALQAITTWVGKDVIELGAGTGRLTRLIAPYVKNLVATDISMHMLKHGKGYALSSNCRLALASHLALPFASHSADRIIAGWSFCYAAIDAGENWQLALEKALSEVTRVLRPGGLLILIESLGTGFTTPHTPDILQKYLDYLESHDFQSTWIRTDYCFKDPSEAVDLTRFFFGDQPMPTWHTDAGVIVPECTGIWWKVYL
jgi:ubiquinone/menaquinone biosynthesis C-methylase UbiE